MNISKADIYNVAVPVRGAGCIDRLKWKDDFIQIVAVPVRGAGCITEMELAILASIAKLPSP